MKNSLLSSMQKLVEHHSGKVFIVLLFLIYIFLNFQEFLFLSPIGPHFTRQMDSLSFVDYYINHDFSFLEPGGWYLGDSKGKAACEFPILYYLTAILSNWFGDKELILRFLILSISTLGFYHFFRTVRLILEKDILALTITFLLLSSTILLYYSVNFLPDAAALGLTLSGYYFGIKFYVERKKRFVFFTLFFFLMASLLKVTYIIHPSAWVGAIVINSLFETRKILTSLKKEIAAILGLISIFVFVLLWYEYAKAYNKENSSFYFLTEIAPYWSLNKIELARTWLAIYHDWFSSYYYQTAFHVMLGIIVLGIASIRRIKLDFYSILVIILALGSFLYGLLFFRQFKHHDYYMLNFAPFFFFLMLVAYRNLKNRFPHLFGHFLMVIGLFVLASLSFNYAKKKLDERYHLVSPLFEKNVAKLKGIDLYLTELGIPSTVNFIVYPEPMPNSALYWIRRPGWNIIELDDFGKKELKKRLPMADYFILTQGKITPEMGSLTEIGTYKGTKIYRLGPYN